jgi:hypothetical protein
VRAEQHYLANLELTTQRWEAEFERKCGDEVNVATMAEEARGASAEIAHMAATARSRGLTSRERRDEQNAVLNDIVERWCRERAPQARTVRCKKAFVFCRAHD